MGMRNRIVDRFGMYHTSHYWYNPSSKAGRPRENKASLLQSITKQRMLTCTNRGTQPGTNHQEECLYFHHRHHYYVILAS
mmetsp:Transcript_1739/g.4565  ORF Transcript_1739/g.4565 Transcript_1739/m.4565 type:complete len:80 (+) Transcript_1739:110-349(+)